MAAASGAGGAGDAVVMEGVLWKRGVMNTNFQPRYFVLRGRELVWYKTKDTDGKQRPSDAAAGKKGQGVLRLVSATQVLVGAQVDAKVAREGLAATGVTTTTTTGAAAAAGGAVDDAAAAAAADDAAARHVLGVTVVEGDNGGRTYVLVAKSMEERDAWAGALSGVVSALLAAAWVLRTRLISVSGPALKSSGGGEADAVVKFALVHGSGGVMAARPILRRLSARAGLELGPDYLVPSTLSSQPVPVRDGIARWSTQEDPGGMDELVAASVASAEESRGTVAAAQVEVDDLVAAREAAKADKKTAAAGAASAAAAAELQRAKAALEKAREKLKALRKTHDEVQARVLGAPGTTLTVKKDGEAYGPIIDLDDDALALPTTHLRVVVYRHGHGLLDGKAIIGRADIPISGLPLASTGSGQETVVDLPLDKKTGGGAGAAAPAMDTAAVVLRLGLMAAEAPALPPLAPMRFDSTVRMLLGEESQKQGMLSDLTATIVEDAVGTQVLRIEEFNLGDHLRLYDAHGHVRFVVQYTRDGYSVHERAHLGRRVATIDRVHQGGLVWQYHTAILAPDGYAPPQEAHATEFGAHGHRHFTTMPSASEVRACRDNGKPYGDASEEDDDGARHDPALIVIDEADNSFYPFRHTRAFALGAENHLGLTVLALMIRAHHGRKQARES